MKNEEKDLAMEEKILDVSDDDEDEENGEMSPRLKNILNGVTDMFIESAKCLSNPHASRPLSDVISDATNGLLSDVIRAPTKHEEN